MNGQAQFEHIRGRVAKIYQCPETRGYDGNPVSPIDIHIEETSRPDLPTRMRCYKPDVMVHIGRVYELDVTVKDGQQGGKKLLTLQRASEAALVLPPVPATHAPVPSYAGDPPVPVPPGNKPPERVPALHQLNREDVIIRQVVLKEISEAVRCNKMTELATAFGVVDDPEWTANELALETAEAMVAWIRMDKT